MPAVACRSRPGHAHLTARRWATAPPIQGVHDAGAQCCFRLRLSRKSCGMAVRDEVVDEFRVAGAAAGRSRRQAVASVWR
jgi:hypothetical protein